MEIFNKLMTYMSIVECRSMYSYYYVWDARKTSTYIIFPMLLKRVSEISLFERSKWNKFLHVVIHINWREEKYHHILVKWLSSADKVINCRKFYYQSQQHWYLKFRLILSSHMYIMYDSDVSWKLRIILLQNVIWIYTVSGELFIHIVQLMTRTTTINSHQWKIYYFEILLIDVLCIIYNQFRILDTIISTLTLSFYILTNSFFVLVNWVK